MSNFFHAQFAHHYAWRFRLTAFAMLSVFSLAATLSQPRTWGAPVSSTTIVYSAGQDGYLTFREPAVLSPATGELLVFADGKKNSINDNSPTDIVLKRSLDNGQTWSPSQVVVPGNGNYVGSAAPVMDALTGQIIVPFLGETAGVKQLYVTTSGDLGNTWSSPTNITSQVADPGWGWVVVGPGHSTQLSSGRIVVSGDHRPHNNTVDPSHSFVAYSDDHGATWHQGGSNPTPYSNESMVAELPNGNLYQTIRNKAGTNRLRSTSVDGGLTWSPATPDPALVEISTQGSVLQFSTNQPLGQNPLLLASLNSTIERRNLTLRASYDDGNNWSVTNMIYNSASAYSDLAKSPDQMVNILYERGRFGTTILGVPAPYQQIALTRVNNDWFSGPQVVNTFLDFNEKITGTASTVDAAIRDSSGYDQHAIAAGMPTYVAGNPLRGGSALHFESGDRVELTSADNATTSFSSTQSFTLEVGFRTTNHGTGGPAGAGALLAKGHANLNNEGYWRVQVEDGKIHWELTDSNGSTFDIIGGSNLDDGDWHDVVLRRNNALGLFDLFIDHVKAAEIAGSSGDLLNSASLLIGEYDFSSRQFIGDIDYARISLAALQENQFVSVPEPSAFSLLGLGAVAWIFLRFASPAKSGRKTGGLTTGA